MNPTRSRKANGSLLLTRHLSLALTTVLLLGLSTQRAQGQGTKASRIANPVLVGDHPDPSIIRVGSTYWMTSTSGDWSPQFALYRSNDLREWKAAGAVFPHQPPWAEGSFWAPELVSDHGRVLVYYVGRKRGGTLCVAVADADRPEGPYTDHGPLVCEQDGSIDPAFVRDEQGAPYLVWKEDGNSQRKPTILWAQPLTSDLFHLTGEKTQLLVNEPTTWEGGVIEAPYLMRRKGFFYMFYAGNACCGTECNYAEGVARAPHLLGPWVKSRANPIIRPNGTWRCPGHGTAVHTAQGEDLFLYHAYPAKGSIYLGRESVLDRITWRKDGWPEVNAGHGPGEAAPTARPVTIADNFAGPALSADWHWPANREPLTLVKDGSLTLTVAEKGGEEFVAQSSSASEYTATVEAAPGGSAALASLAIVGNAEHVIGLGTRASAVELWRRTGPGERTVVWHAALTTPGAAKHLRVVAGAGGTMLNFAYSADGVRWSAAGEPVDVAKLPQWDQGLRVGLVVDGSPGDTASFRHFLLRSQE